MKYPSIPYYNQIPYGYYYAFDKLDGTCIATEWIRKLSKKSSFTLGFKRFETKNELISHNKHPYYEAAQLFMEKYSEDVNKVLYDGFRGLDKAMVYYEFFGPNSFAGKHDPNDEKNAIIFDVEMRVKGMVAPSDFIKQFGHLEIPKVITQGFLDQKFIDMVFANEFNLSEGVVCKGSINKDIIMWKCKTKEWLNKVKTIYGQKLIEDEVGNNESILKSLQ